MPENIVSLLAVGDIFLADSPLNIGKGVRSNIAKKGTGYYIDRIATITNGYDICFGNLECVLSNKDYNRLNVSSVEVRGKPNYVEILSRSGLDIINVANNHIFQHGLEAYLDTVDCLNKNDIKVIGDEHVQTNFAKFKHADIEIGFVGYSMHYEQYRPNEKCPYALRENYEDIVNEIRTIKARFDGILICSLHWGYEFLDEVSLKQKEFCHALVDNGVTMVLGHHPHVPQAIEKYNGAMIAYSLGNFVFDMDMDFTRKSFALAVTIGSMGIIDGKIIPLTIGDDFCPYILDESGSDEFMRHLAELSNKVEAGICANDSEMKILEQKTYDMVRRHTYAEFFRNILSMNLYYSASLVIRALLRKLGLLHNP
jgi:poly-gamma-glutamate synthesis protein (capsule biosynthesis protein)